MSRRLLVALLASLLAGCGGEPATPAPAVPPGDAPLDVAQGDSAFRLPDAQARVRHALDLALFRKGVQQPDPRDAIPAILEPRFVAAKDVTFMRPERRVISVRVGEEIRAYPTHLLDRHELVNDVVAGRAVLVSWCPLCGSAVAYDRVVDGRTLTFGVSGYLYKSDVLMYDHQTESFWSQLAYEAVAGPQTGAKLTVLPSEITGFGAFRKAHPDAKVLSDDQGIVRPEEYLRQVYLGYDTMPRIWFPVGEQSGALFPKAEVVGIVVDGRARAYAVTALRGLRRAWDDTVGGERVTLTYEREGDAVRVLRGDDVVPHVRLFWFAWFAFHPDTDLRATLDGGVVGKPAEAQIPPK